MWFLCEMKYILPKDRPWFSCPSKSHFWRWLPLGPLNIQTNWPTTVDSVSKFLLREQITKTKKIEKLTTTIHIQYEILSHGGTPTWRLQAVFEPNSKSHLSVEKAKFSLQGNLSAETYSKCKIKTQNTKTNKLTTNCWLSVQIPTGETFVSGKTTWF